MSVTAPARGCDKPAQPVGCRKTLPPGQIRGETPRLRACARWPVGRPGPGCACDDLRLAGLKLIFLIVTRAVSLLGLSRREVWWKDAGVLILRHQLAVAHREQPRAHARLTWPDRAWLGLLAGTLPPGASPGCGSSSAPGSILRWHRDILRRRWARRSRCGRTGRPPARRNVVSLVLRLARVRMSRGVTAASRASSRRSASPWRRQRSGRSSRTRASTQRPAGTARAGRVPAIPGTSDPGAGLLHRRPAQRHQGVRPGRQRAR